MERLVEAAGKLDWRIQAMVLLGGDAGLRSGEILALEWTDVDFRRGQLHIRQPEWQGHLIVPKGGRDRRVPMTKQLAALLVANRHLKEPRVLYRDNGQPATRAAVSRWMEKAQKRAGLPVTRALHVLRHTFCYPAVHAPVSSGERRRYRPAGCGGPPNFWRHAGDGQRAGEAWALKRRRAWNL
jgi:integrase